MNNAAAAGGQGAEQTDGAELLRGFLQEGANGDISRAGLILGRDTDELEQMLNGEMEVDEDLAMKIRGISQERGLDVNT